MLAIAHRLRRPRGLDLATMCNVLVSTDEPVMAEGLKRVLSADRRFKTVEVDAQPESVIRAAASQPFDILLLDWNSGFSLSDVVDLQERFPSCRTVLWVRAISTELAFQAIEHGVRGIIQKTASIETVLQCLRVVQDGGFWFEDALKARVIGTSSFHLTPRESDLVTVLAQGMKNKEIASLLFITEPTVKVYLSKLYRKLGVKDRFELALFGLKNMAQSENAIDEESRSNLEPAGKPPGQARWLRTLVVEKPNCTASNR